LLWALRGAGGNFGIVTAFELEAYELGNVVFASMAFDASNAASLLELWGRLVEGSPRELTSFLHLASRQGVAQVYSVWAGDDVEAAVGALEPLLAIGPVLEQSASLVPYPAIVPPHGGVHVGGPAPAMRSGLIEHLTSDATQALADLAGSGEAWLVQFRSVGGAVNDVDPRATAYAHRTQNFSVAAAGAVQERLNVAWDRTIAPFMTGCYLSFDTDTRPERVNDAFPGETLERLRRLKAQLDPENVFNRNFPIPPAGTVTGEARAASLVAARSTDSA
jgi:FAD/FMN-containing dehydrogenase